MPSEVQASDAEQETPELIGDPMKDIIAGEAQRLAAELGTVLDEEEEEGAILEEEQAPEEEIEGKTKEQQTDGKAPQGRGTEAAPAKRLGTDEVLKVADSSNNPTMKEAARIIRSMQTTLGNTQTAWKRQQQEFRDLARDVENIKRSKAQLPEDGDELNPDDPLAQIPQEQVELFSRLADRLGYIKQDAIESRDVEKKTVAFKQESARRGIEKWGESFGHIDDDGQFHFADEASESVSSVYERFYDSARGVTPEDLFVLGNLDTIIKEAEDRGKGTALKEIQENQNKGKKKVEMVRKGLTETGSRGGNAREVIYKGYGKDNSDDVIARAMRAALRELPPT